MNRKSNAPRSVGGKQRAFLFLQGPLSSFYSMIAEVLIEQGEAVYRVNFCGNDARDWHHDGAFDFNLTPEQWSNTLNGLIDDHGISHIILHGDRRYYHKVAISLAEQRNITIVATELGYLRPDWMTVEIGGCSALSHFPIDPDQIFDIASQTGRLDTGVVYPTHESRRVTQELRYTFFNALYSPRFRHYRTHRVEPRLEVYAGWLRARFTGKSRAKQSAEKTAAVMSAKSAYFLFAMQLNGDFQIRDHSPFSGMAEAFDFVAESFAAHAPRESRLIVKTHPLEYRFDHIRSSIEATSAKLGIGDRVVLVGHGDLRELSRNASGFVTVNSSAGMESLDAGCPTISILPTIYDIEGLCFQGALDSFWTQGQIPDRRLFEAFRDALAGTIQVRGTIYHPEGIGAAARGIAERLAQGRINEPGAYVPVAPRLNKAAAMGVHYEC